MTTIAKDTAVTFNYTLKDDEGNILDVTPCAVRFAARFYFVALRYGLGTAAPLAARPKAELQNERRRFWDERRETSFVLDAFILSAFEDLLP